MARMMKESCFHPLNPCNPWSIPFGIWFWDLDLLPPAVSMAENNPGELSDCDSAAHTRVAQKENR